MDNNFARYCWRYCEYILAVGSVGTVSTSLPLVVYLVMTLFMCLNVLSVGSVLGDGAFHVS